MSTVQPTVRPAFTSEVHEEELLSKPVSKMAIASFVLGLLGLFAPISPLFMPPAIVAALLGLISSIMLGSRNSTQSGIWLANAGLFLGLTCSIWSGLSAKISQDTTAQQAGDYALHFVQLLAKGEIYKAAELGVLPSGRRLPGLDLKEYYESYEGSISDSTLQGDKGPPDPRAAAKRRLFDLREHAFTKHIQRKPSAVWKFDSLVNELYFRNNLRRITVMLHDAEMPSDKLEVVLDRQEYEDKGQKMADWYVKDFRLVQ